MPEPATEHRMKHTSIAPTVMLEPDDVAAQVDVDQGYLPQAIQTIARSFEPVEIQNSTTSGNRATP